MMTNTKEAFETPFQNHIQAFTRALDQPSVECHQQSPCILNREKSKRFGLSIFVIVMFCFISYLALLRLQTTLMSSIEESPGERGSSGTQQLHPGVIFVNQASKARFPDGESWPTSFSSLTEALHSNMLGKKEIWIAQGTYSIKNNTDHTTRFSLVPGIDLYGGFSGYETSREQRKWRTNATVLSGIKGSDNEVFQNVYNMVLGSGVLSITIPETQSPTTQSIQDLALYISPTQCDITPVP